jgi:hypothetical protein
MKLTLDTLHLYCDEEGDCLIWKLGCNSAGKPQARLDGKNWLVQRYVYTELMHKELIAKRRVTTRCMNPRCISPDCLVSSTFGEILKRSYASGARSTATEYSARVQKLVASGRTKLTPENIDYIRASSKPGTHLAKELGVSAGAVNRARNGESWRATASSAFNWRP